MDIVVTRYPVAQENTVIFTRGLPLTAYSHRHRWLGVIASSLIVTRPGVLSANA
jgi:hypothetical protein